jgi:hypothetical protein
MKFPEASETVDAAEAPASFSVAPAPPAEGLSLPDRLNVAVELLLPPEFAAPVTPTQPSWKQSKASKIAHRKARFGRRDRLQIATAGSTTDFGR